MPFPEENEIDLPGTLTLNGGRDANGALVTCATLDGWFGSPGSTGGGRQKDGAHGESPASNPKLQAKVLQLTGRIDAPTRLLRQQTEHLLEATLSLDLFDLTVVDAIPLRVTAQRSSKVDVVDDTDVQSTWQAELTCPDPLKYGAAKSLLLNLPLVTGGVRLPLRFPLRFTGSSVTGDGDVLNAGNITAPTVVTFTGPLTTPKVTNLATGQSVTYNDVLGVGEYVVIYLGTPTVALLQGTAVRTGKVSTGGGGTWGIQPGANPISFRAAAGSGTALVAFSDTYQ